MCQIDSVRQIGSQSYLQVRIAAVRTVYHACAVTGIDGVSVASTDSWYSPPTIRSAAAMDIFGWFILLRGLT